MSAATARAPQPGNEKGRLAGRPLITLITNGNIEDTKDALRLQRLHRVGIVGSKANLIASLAWNEVAHG